MHANALHPEAAVRTAPTASGYTRTFLSAGVVASNDEQATAALKAVELAASVVNSAAEPSKKGPGVGTNGMVPLPRSSSRRSGAGELNKVGSKEQWRLENFKTSMNWSSRWTSYCASRRTFALISPSKPIVSDIP